ncbi:MAG: transaldolase family protein, partial [Alphaproteobacteria bacterium]
MKIFLDSADIDEIKAHQDSGFVDGVTTNPSLIAQSGRNIIDTIAEICELVPGPVSAEVTATDFETMLSEGKKLAGIAPNVAVIVPLTEAGLSTCRVLSDAGTKVNVTLC